MLIIPIYGSVVHHKISVDICKVETDCSCSGKPLKILCSNCIQGVTSLPLDHNHLKPFFSIS